MEIGYGLAAPSRGQGYGSEAVAAVTEWLLSQPGVRQVRAHTLTSNAPSRRVLEKAGFTYVGLDEAKPSTSGHKSSGASANLVMTTPRGAIDA